jgi:2,3-bisphosphoglycerate-independent phosphoglycerate mutase
MKFVVIVGDGMADYPILRHGGKTPLELASKPNIDMLARRGRLGIVKTVPDGMPPDSGVANLCILGYDPRKYFTGRGPLEAGAFDIPIGPNDTIFRCNLVTVREGILVDYSAGHVTNEEAQKLLDEMAKLNVGEYFLGISYRHTFILRNAEISAGCTPPHSIIGQPINQHMIGPDGGELGRRLNELMLKSHEILSRHPVNLKREREGKNPANMIWLWGPGKKPNLEPFERKYGLRGGVIAGIILIKGIGRYAGMRVIEVPGATGYYDTNYEGKADYAVRALEDLDFVFVHVEAPDEAGHAGDAEMKVKTIEDLDRRLVGRILDRVDLDETRIAILPDHPTPIERRMHMPDPVPVLVYSPGKPGDRLRFSEAEARRGSLGFIDGPHFMQMFISEL